MYASAVLGALSEKYPDFRDCIKCALTGYTGLSNVSCLLRCPKKGFGTHIISLQSWAAVWHLKVWRWCMEVVAMAAWVSWLMPWYRREEN